MEVKGNGETYTAPSAVALKNRHHVPVDDVLAANYSRQFAVTALASSIAGKESTPFLSEYSQKEFCNDNLENVKFENISTLGDSALMVSIYLPSLKTLPRVISSAWRTQSISGIALRAP